MEQLNEVLTAQVVKNFPAFYRITQFFIVFTDSVLNHLNPIYTSHLVS